MSDVYHNYIAGVEQTEFETAKINQYEARFQWFLAPALVLLLAEIALSTWSARQTVGARRAAAAARRVSHARHRGKSSSPQHSTAA
jgi:Ca-activated chloride channel family protein